MLIDATGQKVINLPSIIISFSSFEQSGVDLIIMLNGEKIIVEQYFLQNPLPIIQVDGANIYPVDTIDNHVGTVVYVTGDVVVKTDDISWRLVKVGDKLYQDEVIITPGDGIVKIALDHGSFIELKQGQRLVLDEVIFDQEIPPMPGMQLDVSQFSMPDLYGLHVSIDPIMKYIDPDNDHYDPDKYYELRLQRDEERASDGPATEVVDGEFPPKFSFVSEASGNTGILTTRDTATGPIGNFTSIELDSGQELATPTGDEIGTTVGSETTQTVNDVPDTNPVPIPEEPVDDSTDTGLAEHTDDGSTGTGVSTPDPDCNDDAGPATDPTPDTSPVPVPTPEPTAVVTVSTVTETFVTSSEPTITTVWIRDTIADELIDNKHPDIDNGGEGHDKHSDLVRTTFSHFVDESVIEITTTVVETTTTTTVIGDQAPTIIVEGPTVINESVTSETSASSRTETTNIEFIDDHDNGHGNEDDHNDNSNSGKGKGKKDHDEDEQEGYTLTPPHDTPHDPEIIQ